MSLDDAPPKDLYLHWVRATGMTLQEMAQMPQHIRTSKTDCSTATTTCKIKASTACWGRRTSNARYWRAQPVRRHDHEKVVRLVPARDANGVDHPDKVYPILRVYTDQMGPDGSRCTTTRR